LIVTSSRFPILSLISLLPRLRLTPLNLPLTKLGYLRGSLHAEVTFHHHHGPTPTGTRLRNLRLSKDGDMSLQLCSICPLPLAVCARTRQKDRRKWLAAPPSDPKGGKSSGLTDNDQSRFRVLNKIAERCAVCHQHRIDAPQDRYTGLLLCQSCHLAFFPKIEVDVLKGDFDVHPWAMAEIEELEKSSMRWVRTPSSSQGAKINLRVLPLELLAPLVTQGLLCHRRVSKISHLGGD
jgi:hypothetical protein